MCPRSKRDQLVLLLQLAYSGELAAAYAYRGHWHSLTNSEERLNIQKIENEEWHHRSLLGEMLRSLDSAPDGRREIRATIIGRSLAVFCHVGGWLAPMFGAGKLESRNIREYETAARLARDCGRVDLIDCLLTMAEVEWEHEKYFRAKVLSHRWSPHLPMWIEPPPKEMVRTSFADETPVVFQADDVGEAVAHLETVE